MLTVYLFTGREPRDVMVGPDLTRLRLAPSVAQQLGNKREWVERALSFAPEDRPSLDALRRKLYGPDFGR